MTPITNKLEVSGNVPPLLLVTGALWETFVKFINTNPRSYLLWVLVRGLS